MSAEQHTPWRWLVFNVGCIECGVSSNIVGTYATKEEANRIEAICEASLDWREGGQNHFLVFDLLAPQASKYAEAIAKAIPNEPDPFNNGQPLDPLDNLHPRNGGEA